MQVRGCNRPVEEPLLPAWENPVIARHPLTPRLALQASLGDRAELPDADAGDHAPRGSGRPRTLGAASVKGVEPRAETSRGGVRGVAGGAVTLDSLEVQQRSTCSPTSETMPVTNSQFAHPTIAVRVASAAAEHLRWQ